MAPAIFAAAAAKLLKRSKTTDFNGVSLLKGEWAAPADVLTVVMIIGGDIVQVALAQLAGGWYTPCPFSFGWVAYSFTSLILSVGENKLMPSADCDCTVINTKSGYGRDVKSWVLGRVMRDYEYWKPAAVKENVERLLDEGTENDRKKARKKAEEGGVAYVEPVRRIRAGLCVAVYKAPGAKAGIPMKDLVYWSGVVISVIQFGLAIIPWILFGDWLIFLITSTGTVLAIFSGMLPQWRAEKWECRRSKKTVALTKGNGSQHVLLIEGSDDRSLDMEDLASGVPVPLTSTRYYTAILAFFWLVFLVTVTGIDDDPWFLMAVGGIGMMQNVFVAGVPRRPAAFGIHLELVEVVAKVTVMDTLKTLEEKYPGAGGNLVDTFFPGKLRKDDAIWWEEAEKRNEAMKDAKKNGSGESCCALWWEEAY